MTDLNKKVDIAIERLKSFEPEDGYHLAYSGGKDSDCIKILAYLADVKFEAVHNLTTADAPETMQYIRSQPDVRINIPRYSDGKPITMWNLITKKLMPPTIVGRYCCAELKERSGDGKLKITGVRWAESSRRSESAGIVSIIGKPRTTQKKADDLGADYRITKRGGLIMNDDNDESRRVVEHCYRTTRTLINPIVEWTDADVWEFLHHHGCKANPLYECEFKRVGCIGCPLAGKARYTEFARYPKYKQLYLNAFDKMLIRRNELDKPTKWKTANEVFRWWMGEDANQLTFEELEAL